MLVDGLLVRANDQPRHVTSEWTADDEGADEVIDFSLRFVLTNDGQRAEASNVRASDVR